MLALRLGLGCWRSALALHRTVAGWMTVKSGLAGFSRTPRPLSPAVRSAPKCSALPTTRAATIRMCCPAVAAIRRVRVRASPIARSRGRRLRRMERRAPVMRPAASSCRVGLARAPMFAKAAAASRRTREATCAAPLSATRLKSARGTAALAWPPRRAARVSAVVPGRFTSIAPMACGKSRPTAPTSAAASSERAACVRLGKPASRMRTAVRAPAWRPRRATACVAPLLVTPLAAAVPRRERPARTSPTTKRAARSNALGKRVATIRRRP